MKLLIITIIFGVTSTIINSQELNKLPVIDSLKIDNNSIENLFYKLDEFEFYRDLTELKRDFSINAETAKLWLEASLNTLNKSSFNKEIISAIDELSLWAAPFGLKLLETIKLKKNITALDIGFGLGFPLLEVAMRLGEPSKVCGS